ncbi:MAG: DUF2155 domain-containing protein [Alphaproteobacteria bacterium]|nr:DUF2155 domain-containing protein [Alphaproteobacteria bacterium]
MMAQVKISKLLASSALGVLLSFAGAEAANIDVNFARMQAMDKITGKVSEIDIPVNGEAKFGSFSVVIRRCVTHSPEETPENYAFVDVADTYNSEAPVNIFKGWMMSSSPALNAVEHPIYDVWLLKCFEGKSENKRLLSEAELAARDNLPKKQKDEALETIQEKDVVVADDKKIETFDVKEAVEANDAQPTDKIEEVEDAEKVVTEVVSVVVTTDDTQDTNDGTPKALLQLQEQPTENLSGAIVQDDNNSVDEYEEPESDAYIDEENGFEEEDESVLSDDETTGAE